MRSTVFGVGNEVGLQLQHLPMFQMGYQQLNLHCTLFLAILDGKEGTKRELT
jgi:hypothetical protein